MQMPGVLLGSRGVLGGAGGAGGEPVSGVLGCCERQGKDGVICRVSLLARAAWLRSSAAGPKRN